MIPDLALPPSLALGPNGFRIGHLTDLHYQPWTTKKEIDDCWHGQPLLSAAMSQCSSQTPAILLVHEPDFADEAANDRRIVLQCSGHSHGGQVRLPLVGSLYTPRLAKKYIDGLYQVENLRVFVSRGIGCTGLPIRFFCPPEIALLSLYHA